MTKDANPYAAPQTPVETAKPFPMRGTSLMLAGFGLGLLGANTLRFAADGRWNLVLIQVAVALAVLSMNLPLLRRGD